jgi:D-sedoheptulose 7-phosphate isomerase
MKGFLKKRPLSDTQKQAMTERCPELDMRVLDKLQQGLPALSLCSLTALNTAFCNDADPELIYAQGVLGMGKPGDIVICLSTSGNAKNIYAAASVAKALGITVIGLTGEGGGKLSEIADICIRVSESETFKIQELHLPVYHYLCAATEAHFFPL